MIAAVDVAILAQAFSLVRILWGQAFCIVRNMAIFITMRDAFEQASEEIWMFHRDCGFPKALTHHTGREAPRTLSLADGRGNSDRGNWTGSVLMYALMFECDPKDSLLRILDQTGERAQVYRYWGPEGQHSGQGQDNDRTNLLESMLNVMGPERGRFTQRAWNLVHRYSMTHSHLTRQQLLHQALVDDSIDVYDNDDAIAEAIMGQLGAAWDVEACSKLKLLFLFIREGAAVPAYEHICAITGCSRRNTKKKHLYWNASERFLLNMYSADLL